MFTNLSRTRKHLGSVLTTLAQITFVELLFVSPQREAWMVLPQPIANVFSLYTDMRLYISDIFLFLTLALWLFSLLASPRPLQFGPWFLTLPIAGLVALSWLGIPFGIDPLLTGYSSLRLTLLFALYLFLVNENIPPEWVAILLALSLIYETGIGLAQFVAQHSLGLGRLGELVLNPAADGTSIVRVGDLRVLRAYGLTEHPNVLGGFLAFAMVLLFGYYLSARGSRGRYAWLLPLAFGALGLLVTFSRAAALGFLAGALLLSVVLLTHARTHKRYLRDLVVAGGFVIAVLALPTFAAQPLLAQRTGQNASFQDNSGEQRSLAERGALLASTERIFFRNALTGVGNGALPVAMAQEDAQFDTQYAYQPGHLVLADVAAELGVVGGSLWVWLLVVPWLALAFKWRTVVNSPWLLATAAALLVITVIGFFDYYPWLLEPGRLWQWSAWGLLAGAYESVVRTSSR